MFFFLGGLRANRNVSGKFGIKLAIALKRQLDRLVRHQSATNLIFITSYHITSNIVLWIPISNSVGDMVQEELF